MCQCIQYVQYIRVAQWVHLIYTGFSTIVWSAKFSWGLSNWHVNGQYVGPLYPNVSPPHTKKSSAVCIFEIFYIFYLIFLFSSFWLKSSTLPHHIVSCSWIKLNDLPGLLSSNRPIPSASLSFILILSNNSKSQFPCKFGIRVQHYAFTFNLYKQLIVMHNGARQVWKQAHRLWVMLIEFEVSCRQIVCDFILCYNYSC